MNALKSLLVPIHREGHIFILIFAVVSLISYLISSTVGFIGFILTLWSVYFFRNPYRVVPERDGLIVSPADGTIVEISLAQPPKELTITEEARLRVSIYLSLFDVHVNRIPMTGHIKQLRYHPGKFINASLDKASLDNERQCITVTNNEGKDIVIVQIAGIIARRIVCSLHEGQKVHTGERFGIIRFGSRVDLYLPQGVHALVAKGQKVIAGETVIADTKSDEKNRFGIKS